MKHVSNELLNTLLRYELPSELIGTNALLFILGRIGRNGNDGFDEITGGSLDDPAVFGTDEGKESRNNVFGVEPLRGV